MCVCDKRVWSREWRVVSGGSGVLGFVVGVCGRSRSGSESGIVRYVVSGVSKVISGGCSSCCVVWWCECCCREILMMVGFVMGVGWEVLMLFWGMGIGS